MEMNPEQVQEAELQDALGACDELYNVISRLKRLGLLTEEENRATKARIDAITETLVHKLPSGGEEPS